MHGNAKLTPAGRRILLGRIAAGRPVAHVAAEMGVARQTAYRWWRRWSAEGAAGLLDRPCRTHDQSVPDWSCVRHVASRSFVGS